MKKLKFNLQLFVNKVPEVLNDFRVYNEGEINRDLGVADIELPALENMTQSVSGVGMAGEVDAPVLGHYGSMETTINWRTPTEAAIQMSGGGAVALEAMGAIQNWDSGENRYRIDSYRAVIRGRSKSYEQGTFEAGNTTDSSNVIETTYLKIEVNGKVLREIDKYAYKDINNGVDNLAEVRAAIGMS